MTTWLLYQVPWWVYAALVLVATGFIYRLFGWKGVLVALSLGGGAVLYRKGAQQGFKDKGEIVTREGQEAVKDYQETKHEAERMDAEELDRINDPWIKR